MATEIYTPSPDEVLCIVLPHILAIMVHPRSTAAVKLWGLTAVSWQAVHLSPVSYKLDRGTNSLIRTNTFIFMPSISEWLIQTFHWGEPIDMGVPTGMHSRRAHTPPGHRPGWQAPTQAHSVSLPSGCPCLQMPSPTRTNSGTVSAVSGLWHPSLALDWFTGQLWLCVHIR
ncbi:unnamed protein product [Pleuronectes platessa]|uniref:Uncharacterized protein n=1 Tax=Pleuronectes platessa TaxID=8262 RepID=A0A9N7TZW4_PLEPL|nr:unnamed protein product [Pleuronectes platessa]